MRAAKRRTERLQACYARQMRLNAEDHPTGGSESKVPFPFQICASPPVLHQSHLILLRNQRADVVDRFSTNVARMGDWLRKQNRAKRRGETTTRCTRLMAWLIGKFPVVLFNKAPTTCFAVEPVSVRTDFSPAEQYVDVESNSACSLHRDGGNWLRKASLPFFSYICPLAFR